MVTEILVKGSFVNPPLALQVLQKWPNSLWMEGRVRRSKAREGKK